MPDTSPSTLVEDRRYWQGDPDPEACGEELIELTPHDVRLLGPTALALYQHLERTRAYGVDWVVLELGTVSRALGLAYRTAKRALARLRDCGAVETLRVKNWWWDPRTTEPSLRWKTLLRYRVWGTWEVRRGMLRVQLPGPQWKAWSAGRRTPGCQAGSRVKYGPSPRRAAFTADHRSGGYQRNMAPSSTNKTTVTTGCSATTEQPRPVGATPAEGVTLAEQVGMPPGVVAATNALGGMDAALHLLDRLIDQGPTLTVPVKKLSVPARLPPPAETTYPATVENDRLPEKEKAELLCSAYREAVKQVYGEDSKAFKFGDITKSRYYQSLKKAIAKLNEHGFAPGAWAFWYMEKSKKRGFKKPPFITMVFSPATIEKWRGWFRKTYDGPAGLKVNLTQTHLERELRIKEIERRNLGFGIKEALVAFPSWYVDMRLQEIKLGHDDPNDFLPR